MYSSGKCAGYPFAEANMRAQAGKHNQLRLAAVEHSWRQTLEGIPTQIGKLAYLASLRTGQAAQYQHYGLA